MHIALFGLLSSAPLLSQKAPRESDILQATVIRVEPWGLIKISCGVAIVYRLAEYQVDEVYRGHLRKGDHIIAQHLACNGNELDDVQAGDKVMVAAEKLSKPEKREWPNYKIASETSTECPGESKEKCTEVRFAPGEPVIVRFEGLKVARLIYPTTRDH